jgi:hypothetical protein
MLKVYTNKSQKLSEVVKEELKDAKLVVLGSSSVGKISYKHELSGSERKLLDIASFSKETKKIVIAGAITDNYGLYKKSAIIAENGKLLGISDMNLTFDECEFTSGGSFKVYQTSILRIGVIVGDDILSLEGVKAMSICDADLIVGVLFSEEKPQHNFLIRAYSYLFGVPILLLTKTGVISSDMFGEISGKSLNESSNLIIPIKKQYLMVKSKRRGVKE